MQKRHKIGLALSMAACMAAMVAAALAVSSAPRPDGRATPLSNAGKEMAAGDALVYFTEQGRYYHDVEDCSGMQGAREGTEREAWALDKKPCPLCLNGETIGERAETTPTEAEEQAEPSGEINGQATPPEPELVPEAAESDGTWAFEEIEANENDGTESAVAGGEMALFTEVVYYNANGRYYHRDEHCSGMWNAALHTEAEAKAAGKLPCPLCVGQEVTPEPTPTPTQEPGDGDRSVYYTEGGQYYHVVKDCMGMLGASKHTLAQAKAAGKARCPVCVGQATPEPTPEPLGGELPVYYTEGGQYYHGVEDCMAMLGASKHTLAQAKAAGKERCPVCQPLGEPAHMDLFRAAFGMEIGEVWPGYRYYCLAPGASGTASWVLATPADDGFAYWVAVDFFEDDRATLMAVDVDTADAFERIKAQAPDLVASVLGADLNALARDSGHSFPGLEKAQCTRLEIEFDKKGAMQSLTETWDAGADMYIAAWGRFDGGFQLERVGGETEGSDSWDVPALQVTVTG